MRTVQQHAVAAYFHAHKQMAALTSVGLDGANHVRDLTWPGLVAVRKHDVSSNLSDVDSDDMSHNLLCAGSDAARSS